MSDAVFPTLVRGMDIKVTKTPSFSTIVQQSPAGFTTRLPQMQNPLWKWKLIFNYLKDYPDDIPAGLTYTDFQTLRDFILARLGAYDDFLYSDPKDHQVGPGLLPGGTPNLQAQLQLIQDSITGIWYSPLQVNRGGQFFEDITDLQGGAALFDNGLFQVSPAAYSIGGPGLAITGHSFYGLYAQWTGTPVGPITAQFNYYFRVRFETDETDIDEFLNNLWAIGGDNANNSQYLQLVTARPATQALI